jgi:hypothetical protein
MLNIKAFIKAELFRQTRFAISNKNIYYMRRFDDTRGGLLQLAGSEIVCQTIWSNFTHLSLFNTCKEYQNGIGDEVDYSRFDNDSYIVFQDENVFNTHVDLDSQVKVEYRDNTVNLGWTPPNNVLIARIPQESNLDLSAATIKIINSGDSKLIADKIITLNMIGWENFFEAKRIRAERLDFGSRNSLDFMIKSYIEAKVVDFFGESVYMTVKKLGVVDRGSFTIKSGSVDIRSAYLPQTGICAFNIGMGKLTLGSCHGNLIINTDNAKINIENLDCGQLIIKSMEDNECEIFITNIQKNSKISSFNTVPYKLFINEENKNLSIKCDRTGTLLYGSDGDGSPTLFVDSYTQPIVTSISSWEYMKRKIQRVINTKKEVLNS